MVQAKTHNTYNTIFFGRLNGKTLSTQNAVKLFLRYIAFLVYSCLQQLAGIT